MYENFLQSAEWEEFQKHCGRKTWRIDGTLIIQHDLPYGFNYLYAPRPADVQWGFLNKVMGVAENENSVFLKIDLIKELSIKNHESRIKKSNSTQPQKTAVLDLTKSEEELLAAMHEKTRYNIRLAERRGVMVYRVRNAKSDFETFWTLLQETAQRDGFHTHEREHYEKLLNIKSERFSNELFFSEYKGKILAAVIINFYQYSNQSSESGSQRMGVATYLHGASSHEHKGVMAPHMLHWRVIQDAKKRGITSYDLNGIDEKRWPGLTRFKMGFGGVVVEHPKTVDVVYRPLAYRVYRLLKILR